MADRSSLTNAVPSYYGANDFRPMSAGKKILVAAVFIVLSPVLVPLLLLWAVFCVIVLQCVKFSPGQAGLVKIKTFEFVYKAPGKRLEVRGPPVKESGGTTSDIIISKDFVDDKGLMHTCGGHGGPSLRKSIECTVDAELNEGPLGQRILQDTNVEKPRYHLHGRVWPYDGKGDEVWTCPARWCQWAAIYSWSARMPEGATPMEWKAFTQAIPLDSAPEVLGYVVLFEVTNPKFFDGDNRNIRVGQSTVFCPEITPENEGKLFVRYGYRDSYFMGNLPTSGDTPDAYIFKGKTLENAQLKVLHTYRLMKPVIADAGVELAKLA